MKTQYVYSHCPVCGCNNVHVHGIRLAEHYILPERVVCGGSNKIAPELRRDALLRGSPKFGGKGDKVLDFAQIGAAGTESACGIV
jgi:hypothetical protein